uniref:hypothetical protein n=1 Tax=Allomeiothermus silvanus TaxID=52022 RepID=UPI0023F3BD79
MRWLWVITALGVSGFFAVRYTAARPIERPPGVTAPSSPVQIALSQPLRLEKNGVSLSAIASFELEARVILKHVYNDTGARIAPVDLALGWGRMSDTAVLRRIRFWQTREYPIPREEIERSSANMHMIPANSFIERRLKGLKPGNLVRIHGYLVNAQAPDGFYWNNSSCHLQNTGQLSEVVGK